MKKFGKKSIVHTSINVIKDEVVNFSDIKSSDYPEVVSARLAEMTEHIKSLSLKIPEDFSADSIELTKKSMNSKKGSEKIFWLQKAGSAYTEKISHITACNSGCSSCCSKNILISRTEAAYIANATNSFMKKKPVDRDLEDFNGIPCCFVEKETGACSIYESRPVICRVYVNMDKDNLLCQDYPGYKIPVPTLNTVGINMASLQAGITDDWFDIRDWFPYGKNKNPNEVDKSSEVKKEIK